MFNLLASTMPAFCLGGLLGKLPVFLYLDECSLSSCPQARYGCFLRSQVPTLSPRPQGLHSWWKAWPRKLGLQAKANPVASARPSASQFSPHSLWVGPGCLRTLPGAWGTNPGWPNTPGSLPAGSLQAAAGVIVSASSSLNAESIETETQTVPTVPLVKGGVAWPCQSH